MKQLKRYLGLIWMLIGVVVIFVLVHAAYKNIYSAKGDISKPIPWIIIISIFTPVAIGFMIFGWYAWRGEYEKDSKN